MVIVLARVLGEERLPEFAGLVEAGARTGDEGVLEQAVVFAEADEDGGEDPGDGDLGDPFGEPLLEGGSGPAGLSGLLPFLPEGGVGLGDAGLPQVRFEVPDLSLEVFEQRLRVDHDALRSPCGSAKLSGTNSCSASPGITATVMSSSRGESFGDCMGQKSHRPRGDSPACLAATASLASSSPPPV